MTHLDPQELELLLAFEKGRLKSVATKAELVRLKAAALATGNKDKRIGQLEEKTTAAPRPVRAVKRRSPSGA